METVHLSGSDDVLRAAYIMRSAAEDMARAASTIQSAVEQNQRFMESFLQDLKYMISSDNGGSPINCMKEKLDLIHAELTTIRKDVVKPVAITSALEVIREEIIHTRKEVEQCY